MKQDKFFKARISLNMTLVVPIIIKEIIKSYLIIDCYHKITFLNCIRVTLLNELDK